MRLYTFLFLSLFETAAFAQSSAYVEQVGFQNDTQLLQSASASVLNEARIRQVGVGEHTAHLDQTGGSTADVAQEGQAHRLAGFAGGVADLSTFALQFDGSQLVLRQVGGQNSQAFVEQRDGAFAEIVQSGSDNVALVMQWGGLGNQAYLNQAAGGFAAVTQMGSGNIARITQSSF